jgi:hypothetical protein
MVSQKTLIVSIVLEIIYYLEKTLALPDLELLLILVHFYKKKLLFRMEQYLY